MNGGSPFSIATADAIACRDALRADGKPAAANRVPQACRFLNGLKLKVEYDPGLFDEHEGSAAREPGESNEIVAHERVPRYMPSRDDFVLLRQMGSSPVPADETRFPDLSVSLGEAFDALWSEFAPAPTTSAKRQWTEVSEAIAVARGDSGPAPKRRKP